MKTIEGLCLYALDYFIQFPRLRDVLSYVEPPVKSLLHYQNCP